MNLLRNIVDDLCEVRLEQTEDKEAFVYVTAAYIQKDATIVKQKLTDIMEIQSLKDTNRLMVSLLENWDSLYPGAGRYLKEATSELIKEGNMICERRENERTYR